MEDRESAFYSIRCGEFIIGTVRSETKCADSPLFVNGFGEYARVRFTKPTGEQDICIFAKTFLMILSDEKTLNLLETEGTKVELLEVDEKTISSAEFEYETYAGMRKFVVMADDDVIDIWKKEPEP